jgi:predicted N-acyltransferase
VFDWAWAEAWQRAGLDYYPKLLLASPFTPVTARLLGQGAARAVLIDGLQQVVADYQLSSAHVLFPAAEDLALLQQAGWLIRHGCSFTGKTRATQISMLFWRHCRKANARKSVRSGARCAMQVST